MKRKIGRLVLLLLGCFFMFWCGRIYRINENLSPRVVYGMNEELLYGDFSIKAEEAGLYEEQEFIERFGDEVRKPLDLSTIDSGRRIVCVCLEVTNHGNKDADWDSVMQAVAGGFETLTWGSNTNPYLESGMNIFRTETLKSGASQKVWLATEVNEICFKKKTWEHMDAEQFYYDLAALPEKPQIRLEMEECK